MLIFLEELIEYDNVFWSALVTDYG